ncbi:hypothetical protein BJY52DRAFT_297875 [Lactarius psammicola]|nr:hypothetical protein BJY52DRAFT_297875 [Lactarius psammicola]
MADPPTGASGESRANVLSPGIVGLFIQGIAAGMIFSQLAMWLLLPGRTSHRFFTVLTVFITTVGLVQTTIYFLSSWRIYVEHYGEPVIPTWTERINIVLTVLVATPVQSLLLLRCYYILKRNVYLIIPLFLLLLGTVALSIFETIWLFRGMYDGENPRGSHAFRSLLLYSALSSILDITLSSIVFYYLTQSRKQVYTDHAVQWISHLIIIVWQSAIPPTLCAVGIFIVYIVSHRLYQGEKQMWYPTLQAMIGNLYVLSHFYNINARPLPVGRQEQPSTHMFTLTVPALHGTNTSALNGPEEHLSEPYTDSFERTDGAQRRSISVAGVHVHLEGAEGYYGLDSKTTSLPLVGIQPTNERL